MGAAAQAALRKPPPRPPAPPPPPDEPLSLSAFGVLLQMWMRVEHHDARRGNAVAYRVALDIRELWAHCIAHRRTG